MGQFKDSENRQWNVVATIASVLRVKTNAEIDLTDPKEAAGINDNPFAFGDTIYELCSPQIEQRGLTKEQFLDAFNGDVIAAAMNCLTESLIDFSQPLRRPNLRLAIEKKGAMDERILKAQEEMFTGDLMERGLNLEISKAQETLIEICGMTSTSLPESSESTPDP